MRQRDKMRPREDEETTDGASTDQLLRSMRGTANVLGDIVGPAWTDGPWDAELGIAYHGENGPVYYTGKGTETTDDI